MDTAVESAGDAAIAMKQASANESQLRAQYAEVSVDEAQAMIENEAEVVNTIRTSVNDTINSVIQAMSKQHSANLKLIAAGRS